MSLDEARAISDALLHHDAIPGLEVIQRPMMPFEYSDFKLTDAQILGMDETMEADQ